jgi:serine/threonine-protein kinase RsbW
MARNASVVEVTLESVLKSIDVAEDITQRVCVTAGFNEDDQHKIEMAVHESLINAIEHGNKRDASKRIRLRYEIFTDRLEIRVRDEGKGFDPNCLADPCAPENLLNISGRGIFLIRTFMDEFRVERTEGAGTEVTMVKRLSYKP